MSDSGNRRASREERNEFRQLTSFMAKWWLAGGKLGQIHSINGGLDWVEIMTPGGVFRLHVSVIEFFPEEKGRAPRAGDEEGFASAWRDANK